ncbi:MAG: hypothetical protein IT485_05495 [Gammaproteobacteria bacterium]|nr:hypothetical protein [Gammaproteobacteria bacterium]QOJ33062.1 MAG: hypothetical protein HRU81_13545 [Gammaproteobacteria bacterium]
MRILVATLGLLAGIFLGAVLLMLNPISLVQGTPAALSGAVRVLAWESGGGFRGFELTPGGLLGLRSAAGRAAAFGDPALEHARVEIVALSDDSGGPPVLGVRLSAIGTGNSLLQARLGTVVAWSLAWPGQGSVMLAGSENYWAPFRDGLWSAMRGRGYQPGRAHYLLPPLPRLGAPWLVSGTGAFAGVHGSFREEFTPVAARPGDLTGSRQLSLATE